MSDGNEDLNKSLLKVARTIQLIQSLDGFAKIIPQIKIMVNGAKDWLKSLLPVERKIKDIAKQAADANKYKFDYDLGGGAPGSASATASAGGRNINPQQPIPANEQQKTNNQVVPALIEKQKKLAKQQIDLAKAYKESKEAAAKYASEFANLNKQQKDYANAVEVIQKKGLSYSFDAGKEGLEYLRRQLGLTKDEFEKLQKALQQNPEELGGFTESVKNQMNAAKEAADTAKENLDSTNERLADIKKQLDETGVVTTKLGRIAQGAGRLFKAAFASLAVTAIITGVTMLIQYLSELKRKAKEVREHFHNLNVEIGQGAAQGSAKSLAALKLLSDEYKKIGDSAAEKQKFLEKWKDTIKDTGIAINDAAKADAVFITSTQKYVRALNDRAKAQAAYNLLVSKYSEYLEKRVKIEEEGQKAFEEYQRQETKTYYRQGGEQQTFYNRRMSEQAMRKSKEDLAELDKEFQKDATYIEKFINPALSQTEDLLGGVATATAKTGEAAKEAIDPLKEWKDILAEGIDRITRLNRTDEENELSDIMDYYDKLKEAAEKLGVDEAGIEEAKQKELKAIRDRYRDADKEAAKNALDDQIQKIRDSYKELENPENQISLYRNVIRTHTGVKGYESGRDARDNYYNAIGAADYKYNAYKESIESENTLLMQKLDLVKGEADEEYTIRKQLADNLASLDAAEVERQKAKEDAYDEYAAKVRQATLSTLEVVSSLSGGLAAMFQADAQNEKKSQKERQKAAKLYKGFAIAQAVTDTYKSANEAYAAMAGIPYVGPALGTAAAAAAILAGIANVKQIQSTDVSGNMSASMSMSLGASSVGAPAALVQSPITYSKELLGNSELDNIQDPIRCYVLESDITTTQQKVSVTEQNATF